MVKLNSKDYKQIYLALNMRKDYILNKQTLAIEDEEELKQIQETLDKIVDIYFFRR